LRRVRRILSQLARPGDELGAIVLQARDSETCVLQLGFENRDTSNRLE
jgi:hypothetical protein